MSKNIPFRYSLWIEVLAFFLVAAFTFAIVELLFLVSR